MLHAIALLKASIKDKLAEGDELSSDGDPVGAVTAGYEVDDYRRALEILESNQTTEINAVSKIINSG